jgi:hypothetical protein
VRPGIWILLLGATSWAAPPDGLRCYYGSTHAHCWFPTGGDDGGLRTSIRRQDAREPSDGAERRAWRRLHAERYEGGTPADAFAYAHARGKLDFLALTIHGHMAEPAEYERVKAAARAANRALAGRFCALVGQEWSTISTGNHVNLLEAESLCRVPKGRYDLLYESWLPAHPETELVILNHPARPRRGGLPRHLWKTEYGLDDYDGSAPALARAARPYVRLIEVASGPAFGRLENFRRWRGRPGGYFRYLNRGFRVGPCVGSDSHYQNWGTSSPARTGVWAWGLTPALLLDGLHARRTFATEDRNLSVWLSVAGAPMGSVHRTDQLRFPVTITVHDRDEPKAVYQVRILVDGDGPGREEAAVVSEEPRARAGTLHFEVELPRAPTYVLAHVVQRHDEDAAWTAPVWLERTSGGRRK